MDKLEAMVLRRTRLTDGYREHAALQSMDAYLHDWREAHIALGRRIAELEDLRRIRQQQIMAGAWPTR